MIRKYQTPFGGLARSQKLAKVDFPNQPCRPTRGCFFMQTIGNLLEGRTFTPQKGDKTKRHVAYEWQAFAYKIWIEYDGNKKTLSNVVRFVKQHNDKSRPLLDAAYSFCSDYTGPIPKIRLFYWKFWQLYKSRKQTTEPTFSG